VIVDTLPTAGTLTDNGQAVAAGQFVSASDIANGLLVFTPVTYASGANYASFNFQVENSGGTSNGGHNTDPNPKTLTVNVTWVNQAPVGTSTTVATLEDTPYTFTTGNFGYSDPHNNPADAFAGVIVDTLPTVGTLTDNGKAVTAGQFVSASDIANGLLVFTPVTYASGANYAGFNFQVENAGGTANGGHNTDPNPKTLTINVTWVNQAPVGTSTTVTTLENEPFVFGTANFGYSDPHNNPPQAFAGLIVDTLPAAGTLTDNGKAVTAGQFVSAGDIANGLLVFTPVAYASGVDYGSFNFQVENNGGTANGGQNTDPNAKTLSINVTWVNQAPVGTSTTVTTLENTPYTFSVANFGYSDPHNNPAEPFLGAKIDTLPGLGTLTDNGVAVTAGEFISAGDISGGKLLFTPATYGTGNDYASFTFQVENSGGTANGGQNTDPNPKTITVNVTPVTQPPQGTSTTVTTCMDVPYTFCVSDFGFSDPHNNPANQFAGVKIDTLPVCGCLTDDCSEVTVGQIISVADIECGKLVYTPGLLGLGADYASFKFQVESNGSTANGGQILDPNPKTMTINVDLLGLELAPAVRASAVAGPAPQLAAAVNASVPVPGTADAASPVGTAPASAVVTHVDSASGAPLSLPRGPLASATAKAGNGNRSSMITFMSQSAVMAPKPGTDVSRVKPGVTATVLPADSAQIDWSGDLTAVLAGQHLLHSSRSAQWLSDFLGAGHDEQNLARLTGLTIKLGDGTPNGTSAGGAAGAGGRPL
jgi:trimeric autotransporter adhesin